MADPEANEFCVHSSRRRNRPAVVVAATDCRRVSDRRSVCWLYVERQHDELGELCGAEVVVTHDDEGLAPVEVLGRRAADADLETRRCNGAHARDDVARTPACGSCAVSCSLATSSPA